MGSLKNYALVTAAYWGQTLSDGALRMLVLLYFNTLGYSPLQIASLFLFYEFFGIVTNLVGGWVGARLGLKITLFSGLVLQSAALATLAMLRPDWPESLAVAYVMFSQALSGIAKDLTKMSSKSAIKAVVPEGTRGALFKWVAVLTGSKNALKGVGFFLGGALLAAFGFAMSLWSMAAALILVLFTAVLALPAEIGKAKGKVGFNRLFSMSREVNILSAARFFLFGARDVWFVVGLPLFLYNQLGWNFTQVGGFLALWVIGYGFVQASAPALFRGQEKQPGGGAAVLWTFVLAVVPMLIAAGLNAGLPQHLIVVAGLIVFALIFAINSAVHSYLIVEYSDRDKISLNVGFYYMANAGGRLAGTVLSGLLYQIGSLPGCLWASVVLTLAAAIISLGLPRSYAPVMPGPARL
jgi:MFS transporter, APGE family, 1-arseno-3-phosphoglycerate exporter